jgi:tripartite-type tricarboxylate transporter receptor subunit TctC
MGLIKDGRVRPLAFTGTKPFPLTPEVPLMKDMLPGYEPQGSWGIFLAPGKTPDEIVNKLNAEINAALKLPDVRAKLEAAGIEIQGGTPQDYAALIKSDLAKWGKVIKEAGIPAE